MYFACLAPSSTPGPTGRGLPPDGEGVEVPLEAAPACCSVGAGSTMAMGPPACGGRTAAQSPTCLGESGWTARRGPAAGRLCV